MVTSTIIPPPIGGSFPCVLYRHIVLITFTTVLEHNVAIEVPLDQDATEEEIRDYLINESDWDDDVIWVESPGQKPIFKTACQDLEDNCPIKIDADYQLTEEQAKAKATSSLPIYSYYW